MEKAQSSLFLNPCVFISFYSLQYVFIFNHHLFWSSGWAKNESWTGTMMTTIKWVITWIDSTSLQKKAPDAWTSTVAFFQKGASLCTSQKRGILGEHGASFLLFLVHLVSAHSPAIPKRPMKHPPPAMKEARYHPWYLKRKTEACNHGIRDGWIYGCWKPL